MRAMRRPTTVEFVGGPRDGAVMTVHDPELRMAFQHVVVCDCPDADHGSEPCVHYWDIPLHPGTHTRIKHEGCLQAMQTVAHLCWELSK